VLSVRQVCCFDIALCVTICTVVRLLLVVKKCVKCRAGLLFLYDTVCNNMYCCAVTVGSDKVC